MKSKFALLAAVASALALDAAPLYTPFPLVRGENSPDFREPFSLERLRAVSLVPGGTLKVQAVREIPSVSYISGYETESGEITEGTYFTDEPEHFTSLFYATQTGNVLVQGGITQTVDQLVYRVNESFIQFYAVDWRTVDGIRYSPEPVYYDFAKDAICGSLSGTNEAHWTSFGRPGRFSYVGRRYREGQGFYPAVVDNESGEVHWMDRIPDANNTWADIVFRDVEMPADYWIFFGQYSTDADDETLWKKVPVPFTRGRRITHTAIWSTTSVTETNLVYEGTLSGGKLDAAVTNRVLLPKERLLVSGTMFPQGHLIGIATR